MPLAAIAGIGAIGSIASGIIGSNAAGHAADTQAAAANNAANLERQSATDALNFNKQQYGNSLSLLSPFYNTGVAANGRLGFLMGLNPAQGLPPGVVNPNAPPQSQPGVLDGGQFDPNTLNRLRALRAGGGGGVPQPNQASALSLPQFGPGTPNGQPGAPNSTQGMNQFNKINPITSPPGTNGNQFQMNPPITSPGTQGTQFQMRTPITSGGTGGTTFQANPPITSGGTQGASGLGTVNPDGSVTASPESQQPGSLGAVGAPGDPSPFGPNGMGNIGNPTPQSTSGAPGQVPRTDGGGGSQFNMQPPITSPMNNPNDPNQGLSPDGSAPSGGTFGSLAQGWGKTFQSPNAVTEQNDPGYQFRLQQGQQALQNSAAARGGLLTGGTAKALTDYNQNAASGEYGNVYNRALQNYNTNYNTFTNDQTNVFNRLMALQSGGQTSANNLSASGITAAGNAANIGLTSAGQIGQQINNAGAANASGYINSANAINGAIGGASNSLSTLAMLRMLQGQGAGAGGGGV